LGEDQEKFMSLTDSEVISAFVAFMQKTSHAGLRVDRWPDKENDGDIDAIAANLAIEHTSIDTLLHQRRDSDWFMKAAGSLQEEIPVKPPFRLKITFEYDAVKKGQNWVEVRDALKHWIIDEALHLKDGHHVLSDVPGIPFRIHVTKASDRPPAILAGRFAPIDDTLPNRMREQFTRKAKKLAKYLTMTKILLVESEDGALMNESDMVVAISQAFADALPLGVDQVWYADTSIPDSIVFFDFTAGIRARAAQGRSGSDMIS
jgi:hypothetical protein